LHLRGRKSKEWAREKLLSFDIFLVTGGAHHTADDFFVSRELKQRKENINKLKKAKGKRQELEERERLL
jgi:hypothetical protein